MKRGIVQKTAAFLISAFFCLTGCAADTVQQEELAYPEFRVALPSIGTGADIQKAEDEVNAILREKLGVEIRLEMEEYNAYPEEMKKKLARENRYDILFSSHNAFTESWLSGYYLEMSDLLEAYGQGIIDAVGKDVLDMMAIDGQLYAVTDVRDYAVTLNTVYVETETLKRFNIDPLSIRTEEDLENAFAQIHAQDPGVLIMTAPNTFVNDTVYAFQPPFGVLDEDAGMYIDLFETDAYLEQLLKIREWHEKGYIRASFSGDAVQVESNHPLAVYRYGKPGGDIETSYAYEGTYSAVLDGMDVIPAGVYYLSAYAISSASADPVTAMRILNLFYTEPAINNALGKVMYGWTLPNLFLTDIPEGYPENIWELQKRFNEDAEIAEDTGFAFNTLPVMKEYLAVLEIYERYRPVLENGMADPRKTLQRMNTEMEEAGIDRVIDEKNRQYRAWLNR